jgi:hypothetical protein
MNYQEHYNKLITRAKNRTLDGYAEKHHIIPKCLGGSNDINNIAILTAEEHFVAHQLLVKIYPNCHKLVYALRMMCSAGNGKSKRTNKEYKWIRKLWKETSSNNQKNIPRNLHTEETKIKISKIQKEQYSSGERIPGMLGKYHTEERNKNLSKKMKGVRTTLKTRKGQINTEEHKRKISESKKGIKRENFIPHNKGIPMSEEQKRKISETKQVNRLLKHKDSNV